MTNRMTVFTYQLVKKINVAKYKNVRREWGNGIFNCSSATASDPAPFQF